MAGAAASLYPNPAIVSSVGVRKMLRLFRARRWAACAGHHVVAFCHAESIRAGAGRRGRKGFPGIGRFGGSAITGYQVKDFDAARVQGAPFQDGKPADARRLEGRITRIAYRTNPGPSILEVARNFETQLGKAGFEKLLACDTDACGGIPFTEAVDTLPVPQMWVDGFNYHYFAGRRADGGRETYASVLVSENNKDITAQLIVAELGAIEDKMVNAAQMAKGLGETGHIALYGIYFDTDKAVLKPESRPTLEQIGKLLGSQPQLNVFIVGHTDNQGAYDYNLDLSAARRGDRGRACEKLPHRAATIAHRGPRLSRSRRLKRLRGRPRAEQARRAGGAVMVAWSTSES